MEIGKRVRQLREEQGLLQEELGRRAGIAPNTVSRLELGHHAPSTATIEKLARGLGVSPADLFQAPKELPPPKTMQELLDRAGIADRELDTTEEEFKELLEGLSARELAALYKRVKDAWRTIYTIIMRYLEEGNLEPSEKRALERLNARAHEKSLLAGLMAHVAFARERDQAEERGDEDLVAEITEEESRLALVE